MSAAQKILLVYGVLSFGYGFALGTALSRERAAAPEASRHLVIAHTSAIMQGTMHVALTIAIGFATLTPWVEALGAILLVGGSALFVAGATANWLHRIGDHFAERSFGWKLLAASSAGHLGGMAIVGVVAAA